MSSNKISFEESLDNLSKIIEKLENGECSLEESIKLFEEGIKLSDDCSKTLENAKQKIISLTDAKKEAELDD